MLLTQESVSCHLAVLDVVKLVVKAAHEHLEFLSTQTDGKLTYMKKLIVMVFTWVRTTDYVGRL